MILATAGVVDPDRETARAIAGALLDERLVACANIIGPIESHFVWQGEMQTSEEYGVLFKLDARTLDHAVALVTFQGTTAVQTRLTVETILLPLRHNGTTYSSTYPT